MLRGRRGIGNLTLVAAFAGFVLVPLLALSVELGRYATAREAVQKAADAAALAAAQEIDYAHFRETGELRFAGSTYSAATYFANLNAGPLTSEGIFVQVVSIGIDEQTDTVHVVCRADVSRFFPSVVPAVVIQREGVAQVRAR